MASLLTHSFPMNSRNSSCFMDDSSILFDDPTLFATGQVLPYNDGSELAQYQYFDITLQAPYTKADVQRLQTQEENQNFSTGVFRVSDMNVAATCVNGVQHFSTLPPSPPVTPSNSCGSGGAESDFEHDSCTLCHKTTTDKKLRRREQNRQSQQKFRARKEAKLSDAKARIASLEALVKAQERTNLVLKLRIEQLTSDSHSTTINSISKNNGATESCPNASAQSKEGE